MVASACQRGLDIAGRPHPGAFAAVTEQAAEEASFFLRRDGEGSGTYARRIFQRVFTADIERVIRMEVHCFFGRFHELQGSGPVWCLTQLHGHGSMLSVSMGCCATPSVGQCCLLLTTSWQLHGYSLYSITHGAAAWMRKARGTAQLASLLWQHLNKAGCRGAGPMEVEAAANPAAAGRAASASGRSRAGVALSLCIIFHSTRVIPEHRRPADAACWFAWGHICLPQHIQEPGSAEALGSSNALQHADC